MTTDLGTVDHGIRRRMHPTRHRTLHAPGAVTGDRGHSPTKAHPARTATGSASNRHEAHRSLPVSAFGISGPLSIGPLIATLQADGLCADDDIAFLGAEPEDRAQIGAESGHTG